VLDSLFVAARAKRVGRVERWVSGLGLVERIKSVDVGGGTQTEPVRPTP